ncbi:class A beta-lactamase-related serine hydrolase [Lacihabitans sp. CS3-21]|nr:class A beta-lactamase-related serine hydrolase [Lacihabitans sp. CS3-21]
MASHLDIKFNMSRNISLALAFLVVQSLGGLAQSPDKNLDKSLSKIYKESNFPGFAISILKADTTLFAKSYGFADKSKKTPYTLETIQPVGSVSKTFIALALMKSVELGYFTLESNINDLLPFKIIHPNFPYGIITVRHLATHTSSLLDNEEVYLNEAYQLGNEQNVALGAFLQNYYTKEGKFYSPKNFDLNPIGTNYAYSNIASALMAYIIESKSKITFAEFCQKYIFQPLKMESTDWFYNPENEAKYATLYQVNQPESSLEEKMLNADKSLKPYTCITYPDGSLKTSASDLTVFLKAMIKGYFSNDTLIIGKSAYQTLFAKQFNEKNMPTHMDNKEPNRAIFWAYARKGELRHTGSDPGVFAFISFHPVTKIGRIMTLNASLEGGENQKTVASFMKVIAALDSFEEAYAQNN